MGQRKVVQEQLVVDLGRRELELGLQHCRETGLEFDIGLDSAQQFMQISEGSPGNHLEPKKNLGGSSTPDCRSMRTGHSVDVGLPRLIVARCF